MELRTSHRPDTGQGWAGLLGGFPVLRELALQATKCGSPQGALSPRVQPSPRSKPTNDEALAGLPPTPLTRSVWPARKEAFPAELPRRRRAGARVLCGCGVRSAGAARVAELRGKVKSRSQPFLPARHGTEFPGGSRQKLFLVSQVVVDWTPQTRTLCLGSCSWGQGPDCDDG